MLSQLMLIRKRNEELQYKFQVFKSHIISKRIMYLNDSFRRLNTAQSRVSRVSLSSATNDNSVATNNHSILEMVINLRENEKGGCMSYLRT